MRRKELGKIHANMKYEMETPEFSIQAELLRSQK